MNPTTEKTAAPEWGRFYTREGELVTDVTDKEAAKRGLYPSVTTVTTKEMPEPYNLKVGRERLIARYVLTNGFSVVNELVHDGTEEEYIGWSDAIRERAVQPWKEAAERGTDLHALIAAYFEKGQDVDLPLQLVETISRHVLPAGQTEGVVLCHPWGYAGTVDFVGKDRQLSDRSVILDFKTQGCGASANFYDEWKFQLAGYVYALQPRNWKVMNIVINTNQDSPLYVDYSRPGVITRTYRPATIAKARTQLLLAVTRWHLRNGTPDEYLPHRVAVMRDILTDNWAEL